MPQSNSTNRRFVLAERPKGEPDDRTLRLETAEVPEAGVAAVEHAADVDVDLTAVPRDVAPRWQHKEPIDELLEASLASLHTTTLEPLAIETAAPWFQNQSMAASSRPPRKISSIGVRMNVGWIELQRMSQLRLAVSSATDFVSNQTAALEAL